MGAGWEGQGRGAIVSETCGHLGGQAENKESTCSAEWPCITNTPPPPPCSETIPECKPPPPPPGLEAQNAPSPVANHKVTRGALDGGGGGGHHITC